MKNFEGSAVAAIKSVGLCRSRVDENGTVPLQQEQKTRTSPSSTGSWTRVVLVRVWVNRLPKAARTTASRQDTLAGTETTAGSGTTFHT